jgi:hypothetical protein
MGDTFALHKQIEAAKLLKAQMADLIASDPEFMHDIIEGETTLHEELCALTASVREDDAVAAGITQLIAALQARRDRIEKRSELKRSLIALGMSEGGLKKLETPAGTVTRKAVAPKVIVSEESDVPTRFWVPSAPKLDKRALGEALKARLAAISEARSIDDQEARAAALARAEADFPNIPGASLSNGGETIQIRG